MFFIAIRYFHSNSLIRHVSARIYSFCIAFSDRNPTQRENPIKNLFYFVLTASSGPKRSIHWRHHRIYLAAEVVYTIVGVIEPLKGRKKQRRNRDSGSRTYLCVCMRWFVRGSLESAGSSSRLGGRVSAVCGVADSYMKILRKLYN